MISAPLRRRRPLRIPSRRAKAAALAMLSTLWAGPVLAHERVVLPIKVAEKTRLIPAVSGHAHLTFSPPTVDFGDLVLGTSANASLTATNTSQRTVSVSVIAPAGVTVSPASFSLSPGATSASIAFSWTPVQAGPLTGEAVFSVSHADVAEARAEAVAVSGSAGAPAALRFDVPTFAEADVAGTDFGMVSEEDVGTRAPTFEMTITNVGGLTAQGVRVVIPGPGATISSLGVCHEGLDEAGICVAEKIGEDGTGAPIFEARSFFGDLAPGASVTALWRIVPANAGPVDKGFDVTFTTGSDPTVRDRTFTIAGEVFGYAIPGEGFLKAGVGGTAKDGFGSTVDPLVGDELGILRPTGFDARTIFNVGDIDTVDLRTGGLTLVIPIGGTQPVRGPLAYSLRAVFNSHIWHRRTFSAINTNTTDPNPPPNPEPEIEPLNAEYPNAIFNLGTGWSFHLGRLFPPQEPVGIEVGPATVCPSTLAFEKEVDTGRRFVYIDANGTQHEFWNQLNGAELEAGPGEPIVPNENREVLYARDGSYLRLRLDLANPNRRWVEEPSGIKRLFVRQTGARQPTLPDEWLLKSIEDPYGNKVTIEYGIVTVAAVGGGTRTAPGWRIRDHQGGGGTAWRTVKVAFRSWAGQSPRDPMVVDQVDLPAFGGGARTYRFAYTDQVLSHPPRSGFHPAFAAKCPSIDLTVRMPRLDRIDLPDGSAYAFAYRNPADDRVRLTAATLPTGATVEYQYAAAWDSPPDCKNAGPHIATNGVSRRKVTEVGGAILDDRRYLRETLRTDDVPDNICLAFSPGDAASPHPPWSEQTVVVWSAQETGLSTASVHHFNIYPFDDNCRNASDLSPLSTTQCHQVGQGWRLDSGRTHIERNLKVSHSRPGDPLDSDLRLSEELYQCNVSVGGVNVPRNGLALGIRHVGDDVSVLTNSCIKRETTYADYEVSRSGRDCRQASPSCLRDSRLKATRTVYHDDGNRWIKQVKANFDGLGHYRKTTTRSTFETTAANGRLEQTTFRNWNPGVGTLTLNDDHTVQNDILVPDTWLLQTWDHRWTVEGSQGRGGEACFHPSLGHATHERTWKTTTVDTANVAANRSAQDLVVRHAVDGNGELELQRFFGANTFNVPTDNAWCSSTVWTAANQDYAIDHVPSFGVPSQRRVVGDSVFDLHRTVDRHTGWTATEIRDSGEVVSFDYDAMGRTTWATSQRAASQRFDYQQLADDRWRLTATVFPKGTTAATGSPSPIRIYKAAYDGLGRLRSETLPRFDDNPGNPAARATVTRTVTYHPNGSIASATPLDPGSPMRHGYDYRGRNIETTFPDGSKTARRHVGIRRTWSSTCVETGGQGSGIDAGICSGTGLAKAETLVERDWKGRIIKARAPLHTDVAGGFETTFTYDPLDNRTSARRTHREGATTVPQLRSWTYDGRGFLTREQIPERTAAVFSSFTTRGLPRTVAEGGRVKALTYDRIGRLRQIAIGSRALKRFLYCDPQAAASHPALCSTSGSANGRLVRATRNNYRLPDDGGLGALATWVVRSTFGYDSAGRQNDRATSVHVGNGWSSDPPAASTVTTFDQSWTYDDLGNVTALGYPTCNTTSPDCASGRSVGSTYRQGFFLTAVNEGSLGATLTYHPSGVVDEVRHLGGGGTDRYGVAGGMPRTASIDLGIGTGQRFNLGVVSYDGAGNIRSIGADSFDYDKNGRLLAATVQGSSFTYAYDNFDNHRGPGTGTVDPATNQLTGGDWTYDTWGNLVSGAGHGLNYDEADKLAALHDPSGVSLLGIYDHDDLRVLTWRANDPINPETTWTLRDGLRVIREYVGLGSQIALRKDYVYAGTRLIASKEFPSGAERRYHEDQVGSTRLITGSGARRVHYEPFGEELAGTTSGERAVGFQGHENDGLTTYMRGRTYLPFSHRFLQVDPGRDRSSWSLYALTGNNPVSLVDVTGRETKDPEASDVKFKPRFGLSTKKLFSIQFWKFGFSVDSVERSNATDGEQPISRDQLKLTLKTPGSRGSIKESEITLTYDHRHLVWDGNKIKHPMESETSVEVKHKKATKLVYGIGPLEFEFPAPGASEESQPSTETIPELDLPPLDLDLEFDQDDFRFRFDDEPPTE